MYKLQHATVGLDHDYTALKPVVTESTRGEATLEGSTRAEYECLLEKRLLPRFGSTKLRGNPPG